MNVPKRYITERMSTEKNERYEDLLKMSSFLENLETLVVITEDRIAGTPMSIIPMRDPYKKMFSITKVFSKKTYPMIPIIMDTRRVMRFVLFGLGSSIK